MIRVITSQEGMFQIEMLHHFRHPNHNIIFKENFPINNLPSEQPASQNEFDTLDQLPVLE